MKIQLKYLALLCSAMLSAHTITASAQDLRLPCDMDEPIRTNVPNATNTGAQVGHEKVMVKTAVETILAAAGNYDGETIAAMSVPHANMGVARLKNDGWATETLTVAEFLKTFDRRTKTPYFEPVLKYDIHLSDGVLALVKADAVLYRFGVPQSYEMDNFTFLKINGDWKVVNVSFSAKPVPEHKRQFDLTAFAKGYAQAWSSGEPAFVAQFFNEGGSLSIKDGEAAVGRQEIAELARDFMQAFTDLVLTCDKVEITHNGIEFHWTFTGIYTGVTGVGEQVKFSGVELWQLGGGNLIQSSKGRFDADEYARQLNYGVEE